MSTPTMDAEACVNFFGFAVAARPDEGGDISADTTDADIERLLDGYEQEALDTDTPAHIDRDYMRAWCQQQRDTLREEAAE